MAIRDREDVNIPAIEKAKREPARIESPISRICFMFLKKSDKRMAMTTMAIATDNQVSFLIWVAFVRAM